MRRLRPLDRARRRPRADRVLRRSRAQAGGVGRSCSRGVPADGARHRHRRHDRSAGGGELPPKPVSTGRSPIIGFEAVTAPGGASRPTSSANPSIRRTRRSMRWRRSTGPCSASAATSTTAGSRPATRLALPPRRTGRRLRLPPGRDRCGAGRFAALDAADLPVLLADAEMRRRRPGTRPSHSTSRSSRGLGVRPSLGPRLPGRSVPDAVLHGRAERRPRSLRPDVAAVLPLGRAAGRRRTCVFAQI